MKRTGAALAVVAVAALGCRDTTLVPPRSLDSPSAMAVARGDVCLTTFEDSQRVVQYDLVACPEGEVGAIALIVNERSDRLALMDLNSPIPRLIDLDPTSPGPNHLEVGRLPVDVAASPDGTVAYTLNQLDRDVSVVDLYTPETLPSRYRVRETPIALEVDPGDGAVLVAAGSPSQFYRFDGVSMCGPGEPCADSPDPAEVEPAIVELPGTVSAMVADPRGGSAWVVYRDLAYATVLSLSADDGGSCLDGTSTRPCISAHVSLTYGCSDGLDNDGDGLIDQQDPQCFGPYGSESPDGIGRMAIDTCADGIDNDGDGLVDRDDPDCLFASGNEGTPPPADVLPASCADGVDNDGDGVIDYPADSECYGASGRTEAAVRTLGFDNLGIDTHGVFVYVTDRANEQVLVVDARRQRLIDAPASELPRADTFDFGLGIDVAPSPLAVQGVIERSVLWVDDASSDHVVTRYDFGAWISTNNGTLQYVDTAVVFCEFTAEQVDRAAFYRGEQSDIESECLHLPEFPLADSFVRVPAGDVTLPDACLAQDFVDCVSCLAGDDAECATCADFADTQFDMCQRAYQTKVTQLVNARFGLRDAGTEDGRLLGTGTCEQPEELLRQMQAFAAANSTAPQGLKCDSLLMPQPLGVAAQSLGNRDVSALSQVGGADLVELRTLQFDLDDNLAPYVGVRPNDQRILNEAVTTTFEGIIPGTQRGDGVFAVDAESDGTVWFDIGVEPCSQGIVEGDRLLILSAPTGCNLSGGLEYEIVERNSSEVRVAHVDGLADVPTRGCFDEAVSYEVRASGEWVVVGETSGFLSPNEARGGVCVPRYDAANISSRVRSEELYVGPYFSFYLYPGYAAGEVEPVRDTATTFRATSGLSALQYRTCSSTSTQCTPGLFPTQVLWVPGLAAGTLLLSPDPNDEFIHVRNVSDGSGAYAVVR